MEGLPKILQLITKVYKIYKKTIYKKYKETLRKYGTDQSDGTLVVRKTEGYI